MSSALDTEVASTDDEFRSHLLTDAGLLECEDIRKRALKIRRANGRGRKSSPFNLS